MAEVWSYSLEFRGQRLELEERQLTVGRSRTCDVSIKDPSVSRRHAELTPGGGKIRVRDLGSSNGTFVNGQRVAETGELGDGDSLGLGDADMEVRVVRDAAVEIPRRPGSGRPGSGRPGSGPPAAEPAPPAAVRPPGPVGEATGILQAQSMRLAEEAMDEAAESTDEMPFEELPPLVPTGAPGAHMAPPLPAPLQPQAIPTDGPPSAGPPAVEPPELPPSPLRTQAIPTDQVPAAGPPEPPPGPLHTQAIPTAQPPAAGPPEPPPGPLHTQAIPVAQPPAAGPPEPPPGPLRTQVIRSAESAQVAGEPPVPEAAPRDAAPPEPAVSPLRTQQIRYDPPPLALEESEPETEKVSLAEPASPEPLAAPRPAAPRPAAPRPSAPPPSAPPPSAPPPSEARPMKDIREGSGHPASGHPATPGSAGEPLPPPSGGKGEILPSLDGFDTTLGPGVEVPESMQRARENMARAKEAQTAESDPLADLYSRPVQLPPVAGFGIRALALVADGVWIGLLELAGWRLLELPGLALGCAAGLLGVLLGWSVWGTTPGKRLFSLYVCTREGQAGLGAPRALLRLAAYLLSGLLLGAGFLMALAPSRLALHDRLAGTAVRRFR